MIPTKVLSFIDKLSRSASDDVYTVENSMGNYDDVFRDGYTQAKIDIGNKAKTLVELIAAELE